jgi:hypothetical protein
MCELTRTAFRRFSRTESELNICGLRRRSERVHCGCQQVLLATQVMYVLIRAEIAPLVAPAVARNVMREVEPDDVATRTRRAASRKGWTRPR